MKTRFLHDERGVAHLVLILLAVVVLGGIGFAGYRVLNKNKSSDAVNTQEAIEVQEECAAEIDDKDFCKFASTFAGLKEYTMVLETEGANGSSSSTFKSDGDNNQMTVNSGDEVLADYITIGETTYVLDSTDDQWIKYTSPDYAIDDVKDDLNIDFESDIPEAERTQYKKVGKEDCGDLTCFKYQIIDPSATEGDEQFVWFDDEDYLLRKWIFTGGEGTTTATVSYDAVSISTPSPVKEPSTPTLDGPSEEELRALMEQYGQ